ncbi:hypothetical protein [Streptomyces sp. NPDC058308]|uniref:nSTAND1 domain-containing NTPase n=1 Tax=Streptomyces sp. NPDC058308 TaxID=3346440 RepID=UPI0036EE63B9
MGRREKPVDPAAGPVSRLAYELRKLRHEAESLPYRTMAQRTGYSVTALSQAVAGERLPSLEITLAYARACGGDPAHWERHWEETSRELARQPVPDADDSEESGPYPGLARYEVDDSDCFFGRRRLMDDLVALARAHRTSVVLGPSGSGKSSLLRAGLIAHLRRATDTADRPAAIRIFTPGPRPLHTHRDKLVPASAPGETWLIVDQFEEVFALCHDIQERTAFLDALLGDGLDARVRVVIGVRADFYARCLEHRALVAVLAEAALPVVPMNRHELREAIIKPAAARTLIVERALTARLVDEVADEPGGLPLMSHALREVWRRRRGRTLTLESYEAVGGIDGAVARTAEAVYGGLTPDEQVLARRLLLRLITPGQGTPDTRRPAGRDELEAGEGTHAHHVLECLARARLITVADGTVDLAHEALITAWPRLRSWIEEDRRTLLLHHRLAEAARDWAERGQDSGSLLRGNALAEAEAAFGTPRRQEELTSRERRYLTAGTAARTRERRVRHAAIGALALLVVVALVAGSVAWQQSRSSERQSLQARARQVAEVAEGLRDTDPERARLLSVAAYRLADLPETRSALIGLTTDREDDVFRLRDTHPAALRRLSGDGRRVVSVSDDYAQSWDVRSHRQVTESRNWFRVNSLRPVELSPDGKKLALDGLEGISLWDLESGWLDGAPVPNSSGEAADFSPSGRILTVTESDGDEDEDGDGHGVGVGAGAGAGAGETVRLWDLAHHRTLLKVRTDGPSSRTVSADDRQTAICGPGGLIEVWDIARRRKTVTIDSGGRCGSARSGPELLPGGLGFTPDGKTLARMGDNGVDAWRLPGGEKSWSIRRPGLREAAFSPDGRFLAGVVDGEILIWRTARSDTPSLRYPLRGQSRARALRWGADGRTLRFQTGGSWREVRSIDVADMADATWSADPVDAALFSPDGGLLSTVRRDAGKDTLSFRHPDTGAVLRSVTGLVPSVPPHRKPPRRSAATAMTFSSDGATFGYAAAVRDARHPTAFTTWDVGKNDVGKSDVGKNYESHSTSFGGIPVVDGAGAVALGADAGHLWVLRSDGRRVEEWNTEKGRRTSRMAYQGSALVVTGGGRVALRPDGRLLATTRNKVARTGIQQFADHTLSDEAPRSLAFSPGGTYLAVGDTAGRVTLWDGDVRRRRGVLAGPPAPSRRNDSLPIRALAFSPDERTLAVGDGAGAVHLWDIPSRTQLGTRVLTPGGAVLALSFSRRGDALRVSGEHAPVQRYTVAPDRIADDACGRVGGPLSREEWKTYIPDVPYRSIC